MRISEHLKGSNGPVTQLEETCLLIFQRALNNPFTVVKYRGPVMGLFPSDHRKAKTFVQGFTFPLPSWPIALPLCLRSAVAKDKDKQSFKLRAGMDKKIVIYVQQTSNKELAIER